MMRRVKSKQKLTLVKTRNEVKAFMKTTACKNQKHCQSFHENTYACFFKVDFNTLQLNAGRFVFLPKTKRNFKIKKASLNEASFKRTTV